MPSQLAPKSKRATLPVIEGAPGPSKAAVQAAAAANASRTAPQNSLSRGGNAASKAKPPVATSFGNLAPLPTTDASSEALGPTRALQRALVRATADCKWCVLLAPNDVIYQDDPILDALEAGCAYPPAVQQAAVTVQPSLSPLLNQAAASALAPRDAHSGALFADAVVPPGAGRAGVSNGGVNGGVNGCGRVLFAAAAAQGGACASATAATALSGGGRDVDTVEGMEVEPKPLLGLKTELSFSSAAAGGFGFGVGSFGFDAVPGAMAAGLAVGSKRVREEEEGGARFQQRRVNGDIGGGTEVDGTSPPPAVSASSPRNNKTRHLAEGAAAGKGRLEEEGEEEMDGEEEEGRGGEEEEEVALQNGRGGEHGYGPGAQVFNGQEEEGEEGEEEEEEGEEDHGEEDEEGEEDEDNDPHREYVQYIYIYIYIYIHPHICIYIYI